MRRLQLFELTELTACPASLRDAVRDALQFIACLGDHYVGCANRIRLALSRVARPRVIDLCSGSGGPWLRLARLVQGHEQAAVEILLSDKQPNVAAWRWVSARTAGRVSYLTEPVDVLQLPGDLGGLRTLFTAFHHFRPAEAQAILRETVRQGAGIGIFEVTGRQPRALLAVLTAPLLLLVLMPFIRPFRWSRLFWTYPVPVAPLALGFDGLVSCLRTYSPAELRELVAGIAAPGYVWEIGREQTGGGWSLPVTYLVGYPRQET